MNQPNLTVIEPHQHVFGAPLQRHHPAALDPGGEVLGQGLAQIGAPLLEPRDPFAQQHPFEAAADSLHFRKFRHGEDHSLDAAPKVAPPGPFGYLHAMTPEPTNPAAGQTDETVDFGFRQVPREAKAPLVRDIFERVAGRYDLMNDLMSGGVHRLWKAAMIDWLMPRADWRMLDVAGGTGDIAFAILRAIGGPAMLAAKSGSLTVSDINQAMLDVGRQRALKRGAGQAVDFVTADAEKLPFADASLDAYTVAFGLRNVTNLDAALSEARRVLKPGGRFLCLEFSKPALPMLGPIYDRYSFSVLPWLGRWVAGDAEAYRYLAESIRRFPDQPSFVTRIAAAGLEQIKYRNLSGGIAALHSAWRL